ncbi:MAG: hypothetical protein FWG02_01465 [Holophagaceae bacterium]|nr:hypothetical protein [Holophagaceae bacterium]
MKILPILAPFVFFLSPYFVHAQDSNLAYLERLNRFGGNKIILLGGWNADDISRWNKILESDDLAGYDIKLLSRNNAMWMIDFNLKDSQRNPNRESDLSAFEAWVRSQYGSHTSRWVALDELGRVIVSGIDIPEGKALATAMTRFGITSTLKQLRNFLQEYPDHIDARTDLLKEVRRRAVLAMPKDMEDDLDGFSDLRTWGVFAREFDSAMNTGWIGFNLEFFRPEAPLPERHSPLMKKTFTKYIGRVEELLRELPSNIELWDMWGWMARGLDDHPVFQFIQSIESFEPCPSPRVSAWLTGLAKSKEDWESVIQLAKLSREFNRYMQIQRDGWTPNWYSQRLVSINIYGYPENSSYYPHIEALLKLGRVDEANDIFDELVRTRGADRAQHASELARTNGFEELAEIWSKGIPTKLIPFCKPPKWGQPAIVTNFGWDSVEYQQLRSVVTLSKWPEVVTSTWGDQNKSLSWDGDDFRWAILDGNGLVIDEGDKVPTLDELKEIIKKNEIKTKNEVIDAFLRIYPDQVEAQIENCLLLLSDAVQEAKTININGELELSQDDLLWGKLSLPWNKLINHEYAIFAISGVLSDGKKLYSPLMKSLSLRFLPKIEVALHRIPSSEALWNLWLFWRNAGDAERDFESILESVKPSPTASKGTWPPPHVLNTYFLECGEKKEWKKIIKLLSEVWDREISKQNVENETKEKINEKPKLLFPPLGDNVGVPLIEALLNIGNRQDADGIINVWLALGGSFSSPARLIELATNLASETMAKEWESKMNRSVNVPARIF